MAKATKSATRADCRRRQPIGQTQRRALVSFRDPPASYAERRRSATAVPETSRDRAHVNPGGQTQLSMGPSVPRPDPRSPYEHLAVALRDQITNGAIAVGQQLPTGKELSKEFGVATATAQRAVVLLQRWGLIRVSRAAAVQSWFHAAMTRCLARRVC